MNDSEPANLKFETVYIAALKEWPKFIVFGEIETYQTPGIYLIPKLWNLSVEIEKKYHQTKYEIIFCHIHEAIFKSLNRLGLTYKKIELSLLDKYEIKKAFEERLHLLDDFVINPESKLTWKQPDLDLLKAYWAAN